MTDHDDLYAVLDRAVATLGPVPDLVPSAAAEGRRRRHRARVATAGATLAAVAALVAVPFVFDGPGGGTVPGQTPADRPAPSDLSWVEPAGYSFVLDSRCGERTLIGRFAVSVSDQQVTDVVALDESAAVIVNNPELRAHVPTLGMLVEEYRQAVRDGADEATLTTAGADHHPIAITIDYRKAAIDDEACYTITDYAISGA